MNRYCLALDLVNDIKLIAEYDAWHTHENCWPQIKESLLNSGISQLEIYRTGNRLFMIMETGESFSFSKKETADSANEKVQEWEQLMWKYQVALPWAEPGEKWILMENIFKLLK